VCFDLDRDGSCDATTPENTNPISIQGPLHATLSVVNNSKIVWFNPTGTQGAGPGAESFSISGKWANAQTKIINIAATGYISRP